MSRFKPALFYWVFIPCDIVSLILQATGGALSCVGSDKAAVEIGENISLAGLIFQVVTLIVFCIAFADYVIRARRSPARDRLDRPLMIFLGFMFAATFFILVRCVYRIVELGQGYFSELFRDEGLFIAFESVYVLPRSSLFVPLLFWSPGDGWSISVDVLTPASLLSRMMCIAVLLLNAGHPGPVFNRRRAIAKEEQASEQSANEKSEPQTRAGSARGENGQ